MSVIRDPGKFEGEPFYARYLYERSTDGGADDTVWDGETQIDVFYITEDDLKVCQDFAPNDVGQVVLLWESDQGFVFTEMLASSEWESRQAWLAEHGEADGSEDDDA
jgi:hypothetical protein